MSQHITTMVKYSTEDITYITFLFSSAKIFHSLYIYFNIVLFERVHEVNKVYHCSSGTSNSFMPFMEDVHSNSSCLTSSTDKDNQ
jgi:hypothetical protein